MQYQIVIQYGGSTFKVETIAKTEKDAVNNAIYRTALFIRKRNSSKSEGVLRKDIRDNGKIFVNLSNYDDWGGFVVPQSRADETLELIK